MPEIDHSHDVSSGRVTRLFFRALGMPEGERREFLDAELAEEAELRREVESLLAADAAAGDFLALPAADAALEILQREESTGLEGTRVDRYELVRELGRGGMGVVYLARRADDEYQQEVALKLIKRGMDTDSIIRRFMAERQMLAALKHPNIARLQDGGSTGDGRPFLVMEYVEGEAIDRYCDRLRLTVDARIRLVSTVASAVQYAHQRLIVHRDLKASNILVTADGVPILLDFGTAKLLEPRVPSRVTATRDRWLTPSSASPEQARGEPVTAATDVYALGALLYRLVTGLPPHTLRNDSPGEVLRVLSEESPRRPSRRVREMEEGSRDPGPEERARRRSATPQGLARRLEGDLDVILSKALEREPGDRYSSVERFQGDLRRYLERRPVEARRPTVVYRASRFLQRRWRLVSVSAAFVALLVSAVVVVVLQGREAALQRDRAEAERARAQEVAGFLEELFDVVDPEEARGDEVSVRELMDRGIRTIRSRFGSRPGVQAALLTSVGKIHRKLSLYDSAEAALEEALDLSRRSYGEDHPRTAEVLYELASLDMWTGQRKRAEERFERSLEIRRRRLGPDHPDVATSLVGLSELTNYQGRYDRACDLALQSLEIRGRSLGEAHPLFAESLHALGNCEVERGRTGLGLALVGRALDLQSEALGEDHPHVANSSFSLSIAHRRSGNFHLSRDFALRSLMSYLQAYGPDHPNFAHALLSMAAPLVQLAEYELAHPLILRACSILGGALGDEDPLWGICVIDHAYLHFLAGEDPEEAAVCEASGPEHRSLAEKLYGTSLAVFRRSLPPDHPHIALNLHYLGVLALRRGDLGEGERLLQQARTMRLKSYGPNHPQLGRTLRELGNLRLQQGEVAAAEGFLRRVREIRRRTLPANHPLRGETHADFARLHLERGEPAQAEREASAAVEIFFGSLGPTHPQARRAGALLARARTSGARVGTAGELPGSAAGPPQKPPPGSFPAQADPRVPAF